MSKKDGKPLTPEEKKKKKFKKLKRRMKRLVLIGALGYAAYAFYNPAIIGYPPLEEKILGIKDTDLSESPLLNTVQDEVLDKTKQLREFARTTKIPKVMTGLPEELVVEDVVNDFASTVKDLPQKQVERIRAQICEDLAGFGTASQSGEEK